MKIAGTLRVAHRVGRSSQATPAALDNSAPLQTRPSSHIYRGWAVQANRATSRCRLKLVLLECLENLYLSQVSVNCNKNYYEKLNKSHLLPC